MFIQVLNPLFFESEITFSANRCHCLSVFCSQTLKYISFFPNHAIFHLENDVTGSEYEVFFGSASRALDSLSNDFYSLLQFHNINILPTIFWLFEC